MDLQTSPAIRTPSKTLLHPGAVDSWIGQCMRAAVGTNVPIPVVYFGRVLGWTIPGRGEHIGWVGWLPVSKRYCGFTTYDDLIAEMSAGKLLSVHYGKNFSGGMTAFNWYDLWPLAGNPQAGTYTGAAYTARQFDDSSVGALYHGGNVSTDTKHVTGYTSGMSGGPNVFMMVDRVLAYESCSFTANVLQAMTNTLTAQRYASAGLSGMQICVHVQNANLGATASNLTICSYTDQSGNAGQSMPTTITVTMIPSAAAGSATVGARVVAPSTSGVTYPWGPFLPLAAGDWGVRAVEGMATSAANTGTLVFALLRPLCFMATPTTGFPNQVDTVVQTSGLERIYDGACIDFLSFLPNNSGQAQVVVNTAWG